MSTSPPVASGARTPWEKAGIETAAERRREAQRERIENEDIGMNQPLRRAV